MSLSRELCARCHISVPKEEFAGRAERSRTGSAGRICISCFIRQRHARKRETALFYGGLLLLSGAVIVTAPESTVGWRLADLFLFFLFMLLFATVHLLAQIGAGRVLGLRPWQGAIGKGGTLYHLQVGVFNLEIKPVPLGSGLKLVSISERWYRTRQFIAMLAGPICSILLFILLLALFGSTLKRDLEGYLAINWESDLIKSSLALLLVNLWPRGILMSNVGALENDGLRLARLLFLSTDVVKREVNTAYLHLGYSYLTQGRIEDARKVYEEGLRKMPEDFWLLHALAGLYGELGDFRQQRCISEKLLERPELSSWERTQIQADLAYDSFVLRREDYLNEADAYSWAAYHKYPSSPYFIGTRGAILAWQGRVTEGERLVKQGIELHYSPDARASCFCVLAAIERGRGNEEEAGRHIERARRLSPHNVLLRRLEEGEFEPLVERA